MKKVLLSLAFMTIALGVFAQKQGESSVGFNLGYAFDTENATLGIDYRYSFTNAFRIAPSLSYYTKSSGLSAFVIDANVHYLFPLSDQFYFYPLAGLNLAFWDYKYLDDTESELGINIGLGGEFLVSEQVSLGLELKYVAISDADQALAAVRIGYRF